MKTPFASSVLLLCVLPLVSCGDDHQHAVTSARAAGHAEVVDAAADPSQRALLELAFEAASRFPTSPHKKNRGRAQGLVLAGCFELGLPLLALRFAPQAEGWRRGAAYADFVYHAARQGVTEGSRRYLALASQVVDAESAVPNAQQWRLDTVRLKIARALAAVGDLYGAQQTAGAIDASSRGAVDPDWSTTVASRVVDMDLDAARRDLALITDSFEGQSLGEQGSSLAVLSAMHGRFFSDRELREQLEERLLVRYVKLPAALRLEAIAPLVGHYLANDEVDGAREIVAQLAALVERTRWRPEDKLPALARMAELRADLGDVDLARQELEAALVYYHEVRGEIFDIYRCDALRPVGLAFAHLGDRERALDLLATALEEGVQNPNARPRCDDLVETCVAMASRRIEPSAEMFDRMRAVCADLNEPW